MSQTVDYLSLDGQLVARVHQYQRPDGSVGGSGRPDPKWLRVGSWVLGVRSPKKVSSIRKWMWTFQDYYLSFSLRFDRWVKRTWHSNNTQD